MFWRAVSRSRVVGLALGGLLAGSALASAADDATLRERIEARLAKAGLLESGEIHVRVRDARAHLAGAVATVDALERAGEAARKEVAVVDNQLQVLPEPRSDAEIRKDVESVVLRYPRYTVFDSIGLEVRDGVVALAGSVKEPYRKTEIHRRVARVPGIRELHDRIQVQVVSIGDDRLRAELVRGIYGTGLLAHYGTVDPPVRILVDRGHVTLTGYVNSEVERVVIGSIARSTLAFSVDNQVRLESERGREADRKPTDS
jgi:osmotically-inducible protein OsmY